MKAEGCAVQELEAVASKELFAYAKIRFTLMFMLKYCERKIPFNG
jgi:hypothetical protein